MLSVGADDIPVCPHGPNRRQAVGWERKDDAVDTAPHGLYHLHMQLQERLLQGRPLMATAKNTPPIETIAAECIAVRLRMLNRVVTNIYDEALRPLGLKVSQMNILVAAATMGTARPAAVCERLHLDVSTLSRNVERMKARGWLEVVPDEDGRAQPFRLTARGRKLLEQAAPAWKEAQEEVKALLGRNLVKLLDRAVRRIG